MVEGILRPDAPEACNVRFSNLDRLLMSDRHVSEGSKRDEASRDVVDFASDGRDLIESEWV